MKPSRIDRPPRHRATALLGLLVLVIGGCERSTDGLRPFPFPVDPVVFSDSFGDGIEFQAFLNTKLDAASIDSNERHGGTASLKVSVPAPGNPIAAYAGGALVARIPRDLSGYDALTFWARASKAVTLDVAGIGNDNTGTSKFGAWRNAIALTETWTRYVIPLPLPTQLGQERGMFYLAEAPENGTGCDLWFDDIQLERTGSVTNPRPSFRSSTLNSFVGVSVGLAGTQTIFNVGGTDVTVGHMPGYLDLVSTNESVAKTFQGTILVTGEGSATVTARLGAIPASGAVTINATAPPTTAAPTPTLPAADVISLFSNAYPNVAVETWKSFGTADLTDLKIMGNDTKAYTNLIFVGVSFQNPTIDASLMTHWHLDALVPNGTTLKIKLVDFGANGVFNGGGDDREHELTLNPGTTPALLPGRWCSLDIPLADFTNLTTRAHLAQMVLSGASTVFVDNVYLHR